MTVIHRGYYNGFMAETKNILIVDDDAVRVPTLRKFLYRVLDRSDDIEYIVTHVAEMPTSFANYDYIMLDHDLGHQDVYNELRKMDHDLIGLGVFFVHSANPVGAENIDRWLRSSGVEQVYTVSFPRILSLVQSYGIRDENQIGTLDIK